MITALKTPAADGYTRTDLNRIVNAAAWRQQRAHKTIWAEIYDALRAEGHDVRAESERKGIPDRKSVV